MNPSANSRLVASANRRRASARIRSIVGVLVIIAGVLGVGVQAYVAWQQAHQPPAPVVWEARYCGSGGLKPIEEVLSCRYVVSVQVTATPAK